MPTQRRRIGFLPRLEVHNIIDKICTHNKISQSKVTGILVEEALISRGVLNCSERSLSLDFSFKSNKRLLTTDKSFNAEIFNNKDSSNLKDGSIQDELQMINDFIEFKFFKNIMNKNKRMDK